MATPSAAQTKALAEAKAEAPQVTYKLALVGAHRVLSKYDENGKKTLITKTVGSSNWALRESLLEDIEITREEVINECFDATKAAPFGRKLNGYKAFRMGDLIGFLGPDGEVAIEALFTEVVKGFSKDGYAEVKVRLKRTEAEAAVKRINTEGEIVETVIPAVKKRK